MFPFAQDKKPLSKTPGKPAMPKAKTTKAPMKKPAMPKKGGRGC